MDGPGNGEDQKPMTPINSGRPQYESFAQRWIRAVREGLPWSQVEQRFEDSDIRPREGEATTSAAPVVNTETNTTTESSFSDKVKKASNFHELNLLLNTIDIAASKKNETDMQEAIKKCLEIQRRAFGIREELLSKFNLTEADLLINFSEDATKKSKIDQFNAAGGGQFDNMVGSAKIVIDQLNQPEPEQTVEPETPEDQQDDNDVERAA